MIYRHDLRYHGQGRQVKTLPLFGDINARTPKYTFSHPSDLLFATQFAQIVLIVTEKAAFEDMRYKGFVQNDCFRRSFTRRILGSRFYCRRPSRLLACGCSLLLRDHQATCSRA
jgi:hypothetical protein